MKDIILTEWAKIKDFNIFKSVDEFSKLFDENPGGRCYKKFTNYPWSKENFFFGTYNELLCYYKNSTEIPFYLKKRVGERFGQLTIKSFIVKIVSGKRIVFAKCLCDCGNECEKDFNKLLEGHTKTCGKHKRQKKYDLLSLYPEIVKEYWDYVKNDEKPENVRITSDKEYWWVDSTGSFLLKPTELTKRQFGTSFHEQCIYFYCKQIFDVVNNRRRFKINNISTEIDIFIPQINIAIEYDGVFWHKGKEDFDLKKTERINSKNIFLVRIREKGLSIVDNEMTKTIICGLNDETFHTTINTMMEVIIGYIDSNNLRIEKTILQKLKEFNLDHNKFDEDKLAILDQYRTNYVKDNITKTCLLKYWDYDKNKAIIPQKVSINDDINVYFKCKYGFSRRINVKSMCKNHCVTCGEDNNCLKCNGLYCPFCTYCGRWYWVDPCVQMKKYYYYCIFYEEQISVNALKCLNMDSYIRHATKKLPIDDDDFFELHNIYKHNKQRLKKDKKLFIKLKQIFITDIMSMKGFDEFSELEEYINFCEPVIQKIVFKDFDVDDGIRERFLDFISTHINSHYYSISLLALSEEDKTISEQLKHGLIKVLKKFYHYRKTKEYLEIISTYE